MEEELVTQSELVVIAVFKLAGSGHFLDYYADLFEHPRGALLDIALICTLL